MKRATTLLFIIAIINIVVYSNTPRQGNWRWYANDGIETKATPLADENTAIVITDSSELRLRLNIFDANSQSNNNNAVLNISLTSILHDSIIQAITIEDTNAFKIFNSDFITDGQLSSNSLLTNNNAASFDKSYSYDNSVINSVTLNDNRRLEIEYSIIPADSIKDFSKYLFQMTNVGYLQHPILYTLLSATQAKPESNSPLLADHYFKFAMGNGDGRSVFITDGDSSIVLPENGTSYIGNEIFGVGDSINNTSWYCIYSGNDGHELIVKNLEEKKDYKAMIFEYFIIEGDTIYMPDTTSNNIIFTAGMFSQSIDFPDIPEKTYGDADFDAGASSNLGLDITYESDNDLVATIVNGMVHITGVGNGSVNITALQAGNDTVNAAESVSKVLVVNKLAQTIIFPDIPQKTYGDVDFDAGASSSLGLDITYESDNELVAIITNDTIHIVSVGTANITASQAGNDTVSNASATQTITVVSSSNGLNSISANNVYIYPNPVINNKLYIKGMDSKTETAIQIFDINGKTVFISNLLSNTKEIDISNLPKGLYFISIDSDRINRNLKFIKE